MNDAVTTLADLKETVARFADQRDWGKFHTPKNLAMSLSIEAAELLEHFQWLEPDRCERNALSPEKLHEIGEECADVLAYLLGLANRLDLDLAKIFEQKMERNAEKYPAEQFRGRYGHEDIT